MRGRRSGHLGVALLFVVLVVLVLAPWALSRADAQAREAALKISLSPVDPTLAVGESTHVLLVIQNTSVELATGIKVVPGSSSLITVVGASTVTDLAPGGSAATDLTITRIAEGAADTIPLEVHVTYAQGADALAEVVSATLSVKAIALPALVTATLHGALDPVSEDRPSSVVLTIANARATPTSITRLVISTPRSITATVAASALGAPRAATVQPDADDDILAGAAPLIVPARSSVLVPLELAADTSLDPGQRTLTVQMEAAEGELDKAADAEGKPTQVIVASQDLKVEVFGESEILGALGVPMLLLLPGLIILTTTLVLLKTVGPWRGQLTSTTMDLSKASFAAVASVFVSLLVALAYPTLTDWVPGGSRNLRKGYGFADFYYVYLWSFAIAGAVWLLLSLVKPALDWSIRIDPYGDNTRTILRKLSLRGARTKARVVSIPDGANAAKTAIRVGAVGEKWLVMPPMRAAFLQGPSESRDKVDKALKERRIWHAWWKLRDARKAGHITSLTHGGSPFIPGPSLTAPDKAQPTAQERTIVFTE